MVTITFKILIFAILPGVLLALPETNQNGQTKQKRSLEGPSYNERNVLYNDESPYGDGFYGFELFRQFFEKSGTILGPLSKLFETFSYDKVRGDMMLLRRFLNIIIRLATLINSFLPVPEVTNSTMEEFSKLYPGTSIVTVVKQEESGGLPDISDIPEKPESIYDYVTKTTNDNKEISEDDIIKELSKIDLQRINKRHQGTTITQAQNFIKNSNSNKKETQRVNNENNKIYFPSSLLPSEIRGKPGSLEDFIRDRNIRINEKSNYGPSEVFRTHPEIDLRSHNIYEADLTVLNNNKRNKNYT